MEKGLVKVLIMLVMVSPAVWPGVDSWRSVVADEYVLDRPSLMPSRDPVKTFKTEEGDVVDCVHIYVQPAFDHPLLKDHVIKIPKELQTKKLLRSQSHGADRKNQPHCPQGTIPIVRLPNGDNAFNIASYPTAATTTTNVNAVSIPQDDREFAGVRGECGDMSDGACGYINLWNPQVQPNEYSASRLIILSGTSDGQIFQDHILAGWMVFPGKFSDSKTRFYTHWQANGTAGCFNLDCSRFVQLNTHLVLGGPLQVSTYQGYQAQIFVCIFRDGDGNWWLLFDNIGLVGYWPKSLFRYLSSGPIVAEWGGEILNTRSNGRHTATEMGSGHPWSEGFGRDAYISNISCISNQTDTKDPISLTSFVTNDDCNQVGNYSMLDRKLFFGGTNDSSQCS